MLRLTQAQTIPETAHCSVVPQERMNLIRKNQEFTEINRGICPKYVTFSARNFELLLLTFSK